VERLTYGHVPVKGHGHEQHHLGAPHCMNKEDLNYTASKRDAFVFSEKVINHLRSCGGTKNQIDVGKVG
jgi:hypothetical protein